MNDNPYRSPETAPPYRMDPPRWDPSHEHVRRVKGARWTNGFLMACALIFVAIQLVGPDKAPAIYQRFGLVPGDVLAGQAPWSVFTYVFLHGSLLHFLSNGAFLFFLASRIEIDLRKPGYLFVLFGAGATLAGAVVILAEHLILSAVSLPHVGTLPLVYAVLTFYTFRWPNHYVFLPVIRMKYVGGLLILLGFLDTQATGGILAGGIFFLIRRRLGLQFGRERSPYDDG